MPLNFGQSLRHVIFLPSQTFDKGLYLFIYLFIYQDFLIFRRVTATELHYCRPVTAPFPPLRPLLFSKSTVGYLRHRALSAADFLLKESAET